MSGVARQENGRAMLTSKTIALLQFQTRCLVISPAISGVGDRSMDEAVLAQIAGILTPAVLEHLPEPLHLPGGPEPVAGWIAARQAEGFLFQVREADENTIIGLMVLADTSVFDTGPTLRLGYLFAPRVWGQGHATEMVTGLIHCLQENGWSGQILAGVSVANPGSSRVLLKAGFTEMPATDADLRNFRADLS
jgi:RimJ/RimL family protein N-acetyltransferase